MPKVKDPVCGMTIESVKAAGQGVYAGTPVYFCSVACKTSYERTHRPDAS